MLISQKTKKTWAFYFPVVGACSKDNNNNIKTTINLFLFPQCTIMKACCSDMCNLRPAKQLKLRLVSITRSHPTLLVASIYKHFYLDYSFTINLILIYDL